MKVLATFLCTFNKVPSKPDARSYALEAFQKEILLRNHESLATSSANSFANSSADSFN